MRTPVGTPNQYQTYAASAPKKTHWRKATCEEFGCHNFLNGWRTIVPTVSDHAEYMRGYDFKRMYKYTEQPGEGGLAVFTFPPGQNCFKSNEHMVRVLRPFNYMIKRGDDRIAFNQNTVRRVSSEQWAEEFQENTDKVYILAEKG